MGTTIFLLRLERRAYLEVISSNRSSLIPNGPWFELDEHDCS